MNLLRTPSLKKDSEYDMQEAVVARLSKQSFVIKANKNYWEEVWGKAKVYREVRIPNIGRVSDVIVHVNDRKIFNIECKLTDVPGVIKQAKDHLLWADYSVICLHVGAWVAADTMRSLMDHGIGLMYWSSENGLIEVLEARHNTYKHGRKQKRFREPVLKKLKQKKGAQS